MLPYLLPIALAATLHGPVPPDSTRLKSYGGRAAELEIATPAVERADIDINGRLDDASWERAALLHSFTQYDPIEGAPASQKTEVLVLVDADAIYFGIKAYDDNMAGLRATLSERDSFTRSDDYIRIVLDTFDDARRAYVFTVNPYGVQHDGIWNEGGGSTGRRGGGGFGDPIDDNPDFLWHSDAQIEDWGYSIEVRVPFKSLRFPEKTEQAWGLHILRNIQRTGYKSSWAPYSANGANKLTQAGKLTGLRNLDMGMFMEINPVLTGTRLGSVDEDLGVFRHDDPSADFGVNATYGVTSNLTLDATYNPDFSQVEADAGQIQVNERFALFFPEKRPFFLEGTEIFGMSKQLIYTRTIANPVGGAKLTGKVGGLNVGYLGAVDESFDAGGANTAVNLLRVRMDLGSASTLGAVYTDRTISGVDYNRVAGVDGRFVLARRYTVSLTGATSFTDSPDLAARETGQMLHARFERSGRAFSFNADLEDTDAAFDAGSGFFNRVGDTQFNSRIGYNWFGARGGLLEQFSPSIELKGSWDHDDFWAGQGLEEGEIQTSWRLSFKDNITLFGNFSRSMFSFQPDAYEGLFVGQGDESLRAFRPDQDLFDGLNGFSAGVFVSKWQRIRGNVRYTIQDQPIFDRSFGVAVAPATSYGGELTLNLYPTKSLVAEVGVRQNRLVRKSDGIEHSSAMIPRVRAQYQFTRSFFVRGIFEYSTQDRASLTDSSTGLPLFSCEADTTCELRAGSEGHDFHVEALVSYEPSPGTVFFVGYSRQMEDTDPFSFRDVRAVADGLFVKLSYRFRM